MNPKAIEASTLSRLGFDFLLLINTRAKNRITTTTYICDGAIYIAPILNLAISGRDPVYIIHENSR